MPVEARREKAFVQWVALKIHLDEVQVFRHRDVRGGEPFPDREQTT